MLEGRNFSKVYTMADGIRAWEGLTASGPPDMGLGHPSMTAPPTAAGKGVALETGHRGYLDKESQTSWLAYPVVLDGNESPERFSAVAYGMEEGLRSFYVILSERMDDIETADLFTRLAGFEERHKDQVYAMYVEVTETPLNREKFEAGIVSEVMEGGVSARDFLEQISGAYHNPSEILAVHDGKGKGVALEIENLSYLGDESQLWLQALELALSIEAQALDLYLRFADKSDNKITQRAAFKISKEEKMHLKELGSLMGRKV